VLYTADPPSDLSRGSLPELPALINFGSGDAQKSFATLGSLRPEGPHMSGEYWAGWFDHWGEKHHEPMERARPPNSSDAETGLLRQYVYVSCGTSFGWMNGANSNGTNFQPDTTSYDYDAPLDEQASRGRSTTLSVTPSPGLRINPRLHCWRIRLAVLPYLSKYGDGISVAQPAQADRLEDPVDYGRSGPVLWLPALPHWPG